MARIMDGKVVVITGAGSGMGRSAARLFHAEGALLVLAGRSDNVREAAEELGDRATAIITDVGKADQVQRMIACAVETYGGLDVLLNVAGAFGTMASVADSTEDLFDTLIDINLRGVFLSMKYAIPHMLKRGKGSIVNVASTAALIGPPQLGIYAATKAGVVQLSKVAAVEYAKQGIRVNALCPGVINTPMMVAGNAANPEGSKYLKEIIPMGRVGEPEEIADALLFLASDRSSYINGVALPIEGGQTVV